MTRNFILGVVGMNSYLNQTYKDSQSDPKAVAVNTDGWLKTDSVDNAGADEPVTTEVEPGTRAIHEPTTARPGTSIEDHNAIVQFFFSAIKGTANIWTKRIFQDIDVRSSYNDSIATIKAEYLPKIEKRTISPLQGAQQAVQMRNTYLKLMRDMTSPSGLLIAQFIKAQGGTLEDYLNRNSYRRYGNNFTEFIAIRGKKTK